MSAPLLKLDFAGARRGGGLLGLAVAAVGALGLAAVLAQQHQQNAQRAGLELRRAQLVDVQRHGRPVAGLNAQNADKTVRELGTPWSLLLAELESASGNSGGNIAVLAVEPDHARHRVRVTAEARNLEFALAYIQRLQKAPALRFPMLDSHELRSDDKDHPVRFQLSADWSDAS